MRLNVYRKFIYFFLIFFYMSFTCVVRDVNVYVNDVIAFSFPMLSMSMSMLCPIIRFMRSYTCVECHNRD